MIHSARRASASALIVAIMCAACSSGGGHAGTQPAALSTTSPHAHASMRAAAIAVASAPPASTSNAPKSAHAQSKARPSRVVHANTIVADGPPSILSARVTPSTVSSGTTVSAWLSTTHGVVAVTAYAGGSSLALHRIAAGQFAVATTLPPLPPYVSGVFSVTFVARDARGRSTQTAVNVTVR